MQTDSHLEADDAENGNKSAGRWTQEEHNMFLHGLHTHQKQWKAIAEMVKTRTVVQIRTHAQKYFQKLHKTNGGNGWKIDKSEDIQVQDQDGRSYAYPAADSRAGSFCSSGDSVDSHGTSAEGVDSDGEAHSPRLVGMNVPKKPAGVMRSGSHSLDFNSMSGSTSCSTSGVNSPNCSAPNVFSTAKRPTAPKAKGDLVRKRSRESLKNTAHGTNAASAPSPKKSGSTLESNYLKSKSGEIEATGRYFSAMQPSSQVFYNPSGYSSTGYMGNGYGGSVAPGPLSFPNEDLRMGLEMVPDFYFPGNGFPEDPIGGGYNPHLRTMSNDTDLTNHTPHYFGASFGSGSYTGCALSEHDDDGLMNLLDKIDWDQDEDADVAHSTADNSRPLSPATDTASSVGSHPRGPSTPLAQTGHIAHSSHVHLNNPVVPFALAANSQQHQQGQQLSKSLASYSTDHSAQEGPGSAATSTESVSSELSRLSAEYSSTSTAPASPASQAMSASIATGIAMGASAVHTAYPNSITSAAATTASEELQPKHRLAFCSVIDELKLVTKVARSHSTGSMNSSSSEEGEGGADHISLFDLFQRDTNGSSGSSSVGRLPPLRSLVQHALARGIITADPVSTAALTANISGIAYATVKPEQSVVTTSLYTNTSTTHPKTANTTTTNTDANTNTHASNGMEFDEHEFDFSSFMDDGFQYDAPTSEHAHSFDTSMLHMQFNVGSSCVDGTTASSRSAAHSTSGASDGLFNESILDNSGALTSPALLNSSMLPSIGSNSGTNSKTATPSVVQRKRGRPRKHSISVPAAPVSTPSATTAKSLLTGPALAHALSTQQYQYNMHYGSDYVVPVNATVLQAFNKAVSESSSSSAAGPTSNGGSTGSSGSGNMFGAEYSQNSRSHSGDHTYSLRRSPTNPHTSTNTSNTSSYLTTGALSLHHPSHPYSPDIRLGLTRTMSSESDTMMANCFDPKLYDDVSYGVGMLEDFE